MKTLFTFTVLVSISLFLTNCEQNIKSNLSPENQNTANLEKPVNSEPKTDSPRPGEKADSGKNSTPDFKDFAVSETFSGKTPALNFTAETKDFKTRLNEAAKGKPNFAGRYIVATWGCGTDCVMGGLVDAQTGNTFMIPFTVCCPEDINDEKIEFRPDSKLIVFRGLLDETESGTKVHYYKFENDKFVPVSNGSTKESK